MPIYLNGMEPQKLNRNFSQYFDKAFLFEESELGRRSRLKDFSEEADMPHGAFLSRNCRLVRDLVLVSYSL